MIPTKSVPGELSESYRNPQWAIASLACSLIAFISHTAAMAASAKLALAIAEGGKTADEAQRLSLNVALDLVAWTAGGMAVVIAVLAAQSLTPRMRMLIFSAAAVANVWTLCTT